MPTLKSLMPSKTPSPQYDAFRPVYEPVRALCKAASANFKLGSGNEVLNAVDRFFQCIEKAPKLLKLYNDIKVHMGGTPLNSQIATWVIKQYNLEPIEVSHTKPLSSLIKAYSVTSGKR
jgi:hypothetical protein